MTAVFNKYLNRLGAILVYSFSGVSFIKLSVDFILTVYIRTKGYQNLCKNPFIKASQGKIVRTCIFTPSPHRNHHIWSLQRLVLLCITSSAYNFLAYSCPRNTMFTFMHLADTFIQSTEVERNKLHLLALL